ncbi:MAG TPA: DUF4129 domain-containing protein [Pyrinomonadaceae bacterium]|nr:DUF4129 domain-containing protein [Pyrinomonadaceae bacterium]
MRTLALKYRFCSRLLVLIALLSLASATAAAVPLSQYHSGVGFAIEELATIAEKDGHESDADYETRFTKSIDQVRSALPKNEQVELEKETWKVDNGWLHTALDELQRASLEERPAKLTSLLESLRALDDRLEDLEQATRVEEHKGATKQKLESILDRPEYASQSQGPNALARFLRDLIRWIEKLLPEAPEVEPGRASLVSNIAVYAVLLLAGLIILYVAWLLFKRFKRPAKAKVRKKREARIVLGERLQPEATATDLLSEAEALARSGDLRAAIRKGYIALLLELGDRNVISLAQYKTNRDYLRSVSNRPQLHSPLKRLTETFERHWYGVAQATPNDWQTFRAGYLEALQTGN